MEKEEMDALVTEFKEWYNSQPDKLKLTVEAIHWARQKGLLSKDSGFGWEVQRRALTMYFLEQRNH